MPAHLGRSARQRLGRRDVPCSLAGRRAGNPKRSQPPVCATPTSGAPLRKHSVSVSTGRLCVCVAISSRAKTGAFGPVPAYSRHSISLSCDDGWVGLDGRHQVSLLVVSWAWPRLVSLQKAPSPALASVSLLLHCAAQQSAQATGTEWPWGTSEPGTAPLPGLWEPPWGGGTAVCTAALAFLGLRPPAHIA